jgi:hypothetical protein
MSDTGWKDYGESSITLACAKMGIIKARPTVPYDPSDYIRCLHFIDVLGLHPLSQEAKELIHAASVHYKIWRPFYKHWTELYNIYITEKHQSKAPKTYEYIQELVAEGRK